MRWKVLSLATDTITQTGQLDTVSVILRLEREVFT